MLPAAGNIWGAMRIGALSGSLASGVGQVTANLLTPCTPWHSGLALALATGGVTGGIAGGIGYGIGRWVTRRPNAVSGTRNTTSRLLESPLMQRHHIFPQALRDWFAQRSIDIDLYTVELSRGTHLSGVHGRGGFVGPGDVNLPGQWNARWQAFIDANPGATAKEIYQFAGQLMDEFGLSGLPIVPYY